MRVILQQIVAVGKASRSKHDRPSPLKGHAAELAQRCARIEMTIARSYPGCFKQLENARLRKADTWPEWCWVPTAEVIAVISRIPRQETISEQQSHDSDAIAKTTLAQIQAEVEELPADQRQEALIRHKQKLQAEALSHNMILQGRPMVALGAWRQGRGIYRINSMLGAALSDTELTGDIPGDLLLRLPEWGLALAWEGQNRVVWLHLDWVDQRPVLRVAIDLNELNEDPTPPLSLGVFLDAPSLMAGLTECIQLEEARTDAPLWWASSFISQLVNQCVVAALYLCSEQPDITNANNEPNRPYRQYGAQHTQIWDVGYRVADMLQIATHHHTSASYTPGASKRPHIRRAHWHLYWVGPHGSPQRHRIVRWLHPILVAADQVDDLITVVRQ